MDCDPQLREAVERISGSGGFLLHLRREGRGIGPYAELDACALQDAGLATDRADVATDSAARCAPGPASSGSVTTATPPPDAPVHRHPPARPTRGRP